MLHTIENDVLRAEVNERGAELWSLIDRHSGRQHLWQGAAAHWDRRAPLLFPICGKLSPRRGVLPGAQEGIPMHGFARDYPHRLVRADKTALRFQFSHSAETLRCYPFQFELNISISLEGQKLLQQCEIWNPGRDMLPFSIGFHAGLLCPFGHAPTRRGYHILLEQEENATFLSNVDGLLDGRTAPYPVGKEGIAADSPTLPGTILLSGLRSRYAAIREDSTGREVRVWFEGLPHLAIWSPSAGAPFVCIEPWQGLPDPVGAAGTLDSKPGIIRLAPGERFFCSQAIEIA